MKKCPYCKKVNSVRHGVRRTGVGLKRKYLCKSCKRHFTPDDGFKRFRHTAEVITAALGLRAKGLSLADVVDHLDQHHRVKVSRKTILDWQNHFSERIKGHVQSLNPFLGSDFHADEMYVKIKKQWKYYWDCLDYKTKFLVADHISHERNFEEATTFLNDVKRGSEKLPERLHTDNSYDYPPAIKRVFWKHVKHVHHPAWKKKFKNNPIERYHNTLKQRYKTMRNFDNLTSAYKFLEFFRLYYNYIRKHTSLQGKTPAQAAKIELSLGRNRLLSIIRKILHTLQIQRINLN